MDMIFGYKNMIVYKVLFKLRKKNIVWVKFLRQIIYENFMFIVLLLEKNSFYEIFCFLNYLFLYF